MLADESFESRDKPGNSASIEAVEPNNKRKSQMLFAGGRQLCC
jgi:hypothetical protein